jgi:hypothetical protein
MLVSDASDSPLYFDNPPRYEWVPAELERAQLVPGFDGPPGDAGDSCSRHIFDLRTLTLTVQKPFPDNCGMGAAVGDGTGDRLYRNVHDDDPGLATLMRFNFETGASRKLFTGKIARVDSVSPGGQYAQLLIAQEDNIQFPPESVNLKSPGLSVLSLQTGQVIFETPVGNQRTHLTPGFRWVDVNSFILTDSQGGLSEAYRLVQLTGKGYTQHEISFFEYQRLTNQPPEFIWMFIDGGRLGGPGTRTAILADPASKQTFWVTRALNADEYGEQEYSIDLRLQKDRLIEVTIKDAQRLGGMYYPISANFTLHRWLVRIPAFYYF